MSKQKKCQCGKHQPRFNLPGKTIGIWCAECPNKAISAINVIDKRCKCGSGKRAIYNLLGDKIPKWCINCKPENAININNKKCIKCNKIPNYNFQGETIGLYCIDHKLNDMIDVKHNKCQCGKRSSFNLFGVLYIFIVFRFNHFIFYFY